MDLTVRRFRQVVAAIRRRQLLERRERINLNSWMTRQITTFIAAGYMTDSKKGNPALDSAQMLAFDEIEAAQLEEAQVRHASGNGGMFDEEGNIIPLLPTKLPAWEQAANVFGDPGKWRGRG